MASISTIMVCSVVKSTDARPSTFFRWATIEPLVPRRKHSIAYESLPEPSVPRYSFQYELPIYALVAE